MPPPADTRRTAADSKPVAQAEAGAAARTEGQRLLAGVMASASLGEVARKVGCSSRQTVSDWKKGEKVPGAAYRQRLEETYGVPAESWDRQPSNGRPSSASTRPSSPPTSAPRTTLEQCLSLICDTEAELEADRDAEDKLMPSERVKLRDTLARALSLRHRLESAGELLEERVVRQHPTWKRFKSAMLKAVVPYPEAARAVLAALAELGESP